MRITRADVDSVDLGPLAPLAENRSTFLAKNEHYRLLAWLAKHFGPDAILIDIGTNHGDSALALSAGGGVVLSFDVEDRTSSRAKASNVNYRHEDLFDLDVLDRWKETLLRSALIFIDVDPHEGTREIGMVRWLQENRYKGLIVLDDIHYFPAMRANLWLPIEDEFKVDATSLGHWSGTGIVSFAETIQIGDDATSNWTLVTGYFDLTKKPGATQSLLDRPREHYIDKHAGGTLGADVNLVVFCEPDVEAKIWEMRPRALHPKTRVEVCEFEDFPLTHWIPRVEEARGGPACSRDPRNTASYYLFCMARYAMLKKAIAKNPFASTHFGWINICIERMGPKNLTSLQNALSVQRRKFSTCFIDYVSKQETLDLPRYFGPQGCKTCAARCSMCSGFFTGETHYMNEVCCLMEEEFIRCAELGFGHADEQLMPIIYHKRPELFDWYCGDYSEMITNYAGVHEHPEKPIRLLIARALAAGDRRVAERAAEIVWSSYMKRECSLEPNDHVALLKAMGR